MTSITTKTTVRTKVSAIAESHSRTLLKARDLVDISDEPEARGGTNEGFAPTEMALAALSACTNVIAHKIANQHKINIDEMEVLIDAEFNRLGVTLQEEIDVPFPEILITIKMKTDATEQQLQNLKRDLPRFCPVSKVFSESGSKLLTNWIVNE